MSGSAEMTVLEPFSDYPDGKKEVAYAKGDHITVTASRATELRDRGLARSLPKPKAEPKASGAKTTEPDAAD